MKAARMAALMTVAAALALASPALVALEAIDAAGRTVRLDQPARRIVALAPHVVENVFSAGAGDRLVGAVSYSNFPEAARDIPRVGSYQAWSLESIVAKNPDLVLMWGSGNSLEGLPALEQLGIAVYISEPKRLEDIPATLRDIGQLAGTGEVAEANARAFEQTLQQLRADYAAGPARRVFYEVWNQPLQTLNGEHYISDVITLCGGQNIFADSPHIAPRVSVEAVLARDPDIIIASGMGDARPEWLDDWRDYPHLTAVRNQALFFVHPDLLQRPTTRLLDGAKTLCEQIASQR
ncbi:cobalamin-binding protein [Parahaliea mediterranea]|uniref:cobalamin-binding protein n=1 Tax=Parahaliea mediterranea TaxID=651086 RepID=UPI001F4E4A5A|nr:cobalamin-binding protein [Parahaliea mediterranea]